MTILTLLAARIGDTTGVGSRTLSSPEPWCSTCSGPRCPNPREPSAWVVARGVDCRGVMNAPLPAENPRRASLPDDVDILKGIVVSLTDEVERLKRNERALQGKVDHLLRQLRGPKSEAMDPAQLLLFALPEMAPALQIEPEGPAEEDASTAKPRRRRRGATRPLLREREVHEVPEAERRCSCCGVPMDVIREEITEQYDYRQAAVFIREHVRPVYACTKGCATRPVIAPKPAQPIEKGLPGPGLLAYILTAKYSDSLPLYRLEGILERHGLEVSRSTMCGWVRQVAELVQPVVDHMKADVLRSLVVATDETPLLVLDRRNETTFRGRIWVYCGDRDHPWLVYEYTPTRGRDGPARFLAGYRGYLQADAYSGYDGIYASGEIVELGCLMHCRRYWVEAAEVEPALPMQAVGMIGVLYRIERACAGLSPEERHARRREKALPVFDRFQAWLDEVEPRALPKSPLGDAVRYTRNQWDALKRYTEDGRFEPDNGRSERALKLVAINRKNWLFAGSENGGRWAATIWSLVSTCRLHHLDPEAYLRDLLRELPSLPHRLVPDWTPLAWARRSAPPLPTS